MLCCDRYHLNMSLNSEISCTQSQSQCTAELSPVLRRHRPAYAALPFLVPYTNRPFGHRRSYAKRLVITASVPARLSSPQAATASMIIADDTGRLIRRRPI